MLRDSEGIVTAPIYRIWHVPYGILACTQSRTMSCGKKIIGGSALVMAGHWSTLVLHSSWLVPTGEQFTWRVHLWRGEEEGGLQTPFLELNQDIKTFPFRRSFPVLLYPPPFQGTPSTDGVCRTDACLTCREPLTHVHLMLYQL